MNKYLIMTATALLATSGASHAAGFTFGTANGGSYCDGGTITTRLGGGAAAGWIHVLDGGKGKKSSWGGACGSGETSGQGLLEKVKELGDVFVVSDTAFGKEEDIFSKQLQYTLPKKLKNGQPWTMWIGMNGTSSFEANSGVLVNAGGNALKLEASSALKLLIEGRRDRN
jgi:hypothetical protein